MTGLQRGLLAVVVAVPLGGAIAVVATNPHPLYRANPDGMARPADPSMAYPDLSLMDGGERMQIVFEHGAQDSLYVVDAASGETLRRYGANEGGFVRGVLRPLDHERKRHGVARAEPYEVVRESGGRLTLRDEASNVEIDVAAFGPTSYQLFSSLLDGSESPDVPSLIASPASMEDRP